MTEIVAAANSGSNTLATVVITGGFGVAIAVLTVIGTLIVERSRREETDRRWLLDRGHSDVVHFLAQANACSRQFRLGQKPTPERLAAMLAAEDAFFRAAITSSRTIEPLIDRAFGALMDIGEATTPARREAANDDFVERVRTVLAMARREVQPQRPAAPSWKARLRQLRRRPGRMP